MSPKKPRRVLGYARVSSMEQALGTSLADQQEVMRAYAAKHSLTMTKIYVEAESAIQEKIERREQMRALMADVCSGDLVLCDKLDRWSRDPEFTYGSVRRILEAGASFYAVGDACDPSTSEGDTMLGFRILVAREEHKRIKQRMVGTRNLLRARGLYAAGDLPLGYRRQTEAPNRLDRNRLVVVPEEAAVVREIFERYVGGASMQKIAKAMELKLDRVKDALHRRTYLGEVQGPPTAPGRMDGPWIPNCHEAIIDRAQWERVHVLIAKRRLGGPRSRNDEKAETATWMLRDVAVCGHCGAKMGAAYGGPRGPKRRFYYRCYAKCTAKGPRERTQSFVRIDDVEEYGAEVVLERLVLLRDELKQGSSTKRKRSDERPDFAAKRAALQRKRERHLEAHANELSTLEELRGALGRVDAALAKLDAEEAEHERPSPLEDPKVQRALLGQLGELERAFAHCSPQQGRAIVNLLVESVGLVSGKEPRFVWRDIEHVRAHLDGIREGLLHSLRTAPSHSEIVDELFERISRR